MNEQASQTSAPVAVSEQEVWDQLRNCYDPEIPLNIVDLGLVSDILIKEDRVYFSITVPASRAGSTLPDGCGTAGSRNARTTCTSASAFL